VNTDKINIKLINMVAKYHVNWFMSNIVDISNNSVNLTYCSLGFFIKIKVSSSSYWSKINLWKMKNMLVKLVNYFIY